MSASVRISALSSSTTSTGSGSADVSDSIEDIHDLLYGERLLEICTHPGRGDLGMYFFFRFLAAAVQDDRHRGTRAVHLLDGIVHRRRSDARVQQHRDRALLGH